MVCLGNICINTLHKGDYDDDDNNNNNNNNNNHRVCNAKLDCKEIKHFALQETETMEPRKVGTVQYTYVCIYIYIYIFIYIYIYLYLYTYVYVP